MRGPGDDEREVAAERSHQEQAPHAGYSVTSEICGTCAPVVRTSLPLKRMRIPAKAFVGPGLERSELCWRLTSCRLAEVAG
jgi:hypothetical protein